MGAIDRDTAISEIYGTFREKERGRIELQCKVDDERWRLQKHTTWIGRARTLLGIVFACSLVWALFVSYQDERPRVHSHDAIEPESSPSAVMTSTDTKHIQKVHIYRGPNGEIQSEFGGGKSETQTADVSAVFNDSLHQIGWSQLWIKTADLLPEEYTDKAAARKRRREIMYSAGYAEGLLTHHRIDQHFHNVYNTFFPNGDAADNQTVADLHEFFARNLAWMHKQIRHHEDAENLPEAEYWEGMSYILAQFDGLVAGYQHGSEAPVPASALDLFMLNADGDLEDIIPVVQRARKNEGDEEVNPITQEFYHFLKNLKCSALIRILPAFSDLAWGHATWDSYASMNRIYKHYEVPLPGGETHDTAVKRKISMSSSPGFLSSVDDWYMTNAGLGVMETTHGVFDPSLYEMVTPHSVPCWLRSKIANYLATDGPSWAATFAKYNSGTYNNQWMVVDTKRFVKGEGFQSNGLTVLEQLPGFIQVQDMSTVANEQGYWASYNVPYFEAIYLRSGFMNAYMSTNKSTSWSHEECPRAKIFRRDAPTIESLDDLKRVMRSNNWHDDPLSSGHPSRAISSRYDLETDPGMFSLDGAIDAKVTTLDMFSRLECDAIAGPTQQNNPVFEWTSDLDAIAAHKGHPDRFDFAFETMAASSHRHP